MTRKEKKEEALKLRAALDEKKPKPESKIITRQQMDLNNRRRQQLQKSKSRKKSKIFKEVDKSKWDFEQW